jgi:hypothetical protein
MNNHPRRSFFSITNYELRITADFGSITNFFQLRITNHVFSPRCGVFVTQRAQGLRKGRKGFASFAKGVRLRVLRA